jgi:transcriptional regulator with AbiEi antitoxin domain of type IV toxin-antitoxin system
MPRTLSIHGLRELLDSQLALASRGQLLALGMNDRAMQYRLRPGGPWQALLPGIYLAVTGTPTFEQKEMAALLYAGPESLVTGRAALWHHGIGSGWPPDVVDVLVPAERQRVDVNFVRLHRTARLPSEAVPAGTGPGGTGPGGAGSGGPLRLAPAPRAVADAAWQLTSAEDVRAVVDDALRSGRCTLDELTAELNEGPIRGSAALRTVLAELTEEASAPTAAR